MINSNTFNLLNINIRKRKITSINFITKKNLIKTKTLIKYNIIKDCQINNFKYVNRLSLYKNNLKIKNISNDF